MDEEADSISNLPDILLSSIISSLTITEAARTSTFSQRWKTLWKYSSNLNFDQSQMLKSLIEDYRESSNISKRLERAVRRKIAPKDDSDMDPIAESTMLIISIIDNHIGTLESCRILHLLESSASGDVLRWMKKLREKGVIKVSMEVEIRDDHNTIMPFDVFTSFKDLELQNYFITVKPCPNHHQVLKTLTLNNVRVFSDNFQEILPHCLSLENLTLKQCQFIGNDVIIDSLSLKYFKIFDMIVHKILVSAANIEVIEIGSIFCNPEDLVFETPKLLVLHAHNDVKKLGRRFTTRDIIEICSGILVSLSSHLYYISVGN
ncbi:putative F-box/LRR-repeat protein [Trifolium repens]|nr:putative F-box/LRR-repeat protein [Trifolium repens]